jgi:nucleotide-binding universal stress UspA family protein
MVTPEEFSALKVRRRAVPRSIAVELILAHAFADKVDLIGFGVRKAGEITSHFRGTVPYKVMLEAECPVLTSHFGDGW